MVVQSAMNHALWSRCHKFEFSIFLPLWGHVKKNNERKYLTWNRPLNLLYVSTILSKMLENKDSGHSLFEVYRATANLFGVSDCGPK